MDSLEFFGKLENTGNHYSYFKKGRKFVCFSTGGWSENEELISDLKKERIFHILLVEWRTGGHYKFKILSKEMLNTDFDKQVKVNGVGGE